MNKQQIAEEIEPILEKQRLNCQASFFKDPIMGAIGMGMAQTVRLTQSNCHEHGFRYDQNSKRFI